MADDNHVIRIILEGRDKLSGAFRNAKKSLDSDIGSVRKSIQDLNKELKIVENSTAFGGGKSVRGRSGFVNLAKEVEAAKGSVKDLKKELRDLLPQELQNGGRRFFLSLKEGLGEASQAGKNLNLRLSQEQQIVRERRRLLDDEVRAGQIELNNEKFIAKQKLESELKAQRDGNNLAIKNLKEIQRQKEFQVRQLAKEENDLRRAQFQERKREITLLAREETTPLVQSRRRERDPEAIIEIDRAIHNIRADRDRQIQELKDELRTEIDKRNESVDQIIKKQKQALADEVRTRADSLKRETTERKEALRTANAQTQAEFSRQNLEKRAQIISPDQDVIRRQEADLRRLNNEAHKTDDFFRRAGRSVGLWAGDLKRGIGEGKRGLVDFESEGRRLESVMARIGQRIGSITGNLGNLVNIRWFFLSSAVQLLGTVVLNLGAAFASLASSAALAASAVGAGFAGAVAQALPVAGLLTAAFSRIQNVFKAVQLFNTNKVATSADATQQAQQQREANERLADSHHTLQQAIIGVTEAQYNLKQAGLDVTDALTRNKEAVLNLANTRIQVSRGIVDASFREREAALSLRSAELGVYDAKKQLLEIEKEQKNNQADIDAARGAVREAQQRLTAAQNASDAAGIANARAQLAVAQQSLSQIEVTARTTNTAIKEAKVGVKQAELDRDKAKVENNRAKEDNKKTQKEGIAGNQQYIAALRQVKDSVHAISTARHQEAQAQRQVAEALYQVKIATREVKDLEEDKAKGLNSQIAGQRQLKAILDQLSPSERKLYQSLLNIQNVYKRAFRPITDIIVSAVARAVDRAAKLLQDPKILKAATGLATAIAGGIDRVSQFASSPRVTRDLVFFIENATKNLPKVVDALLNVVDAFLHLARIGTPFFNRFVDFIDKATGRVDKFLSNKKETDEFFGLAKKNLDAWIGLAGAIGRIFLAIAKGSNKSGLSLVQDLTDFLNGLADWMRDHPKEVDAFFERMARNTEKLAKALADLAVVLFKAFSSDAAVDFVTFLTKEVIPGITLFFGVLQKISQVILFLTRIPFVGPIVEFGVQLLVAEKILNKVFPVTQKLTDAFKLLSKTVGLIVSKGLIRGLAEAFPKLAAGIRLVGVALRFVFITNPWIAVISGIILAVVLLDRKFHFLRPTILALRKALDAVVDWVKHNWKLLLVLIAAPFAGAVLLIIKYRNQIIHAFGEVIDWFRNHWKTIAKIIVAIFTFPASAIAIAVLKWHDKMIEIGKRVVDGITGWFKKLPGLLFNALKGIPDKIASAFTGTGKKIAKKIYDELPGPARKVLGWGADVAGKVGDVAGGAKDLTKKGFSKLGLAGGGTVYASTGLSGLFRPLGTDTVPAMLTPGEWVLNKLQQNKLAQALRTTTKKVASLLFGTPAGPIPSPDVPSDISGPYSGFGGQNFSLTPHQDDSGRTVWFAEFKDKTYAQINTLDAYRMINTKGTYVPEYLKRYASRHGGLLPGTLRPLRSGLQTALGRGVAFKTPYGLGGAGVSARGYARGGPVINSPAGRVGGGNTLHQNFNVRTEGDTDWNYVMRLGALHAQESY